MIYIRDGTRCFVSNTLRKEHYITDGPLIKEPKIKMKYLKHEYYQTFVTIDFAKSMIRFKPSGKTRDDCEDFV